MAVGCGRLVDLAEISGLGEVDKATAGASGAFTGDVGEEQGRQTLDEVAVFRAADHLDRSTYHVHLTVTDFVEPGPCKDSGAVLHLLGDRDLELARTFLVDIVAALGTMLSAVGVLCCSWDVTDCLGRAPSDHAVDGSPVGDVV